MKTFSVCIFLFLLSFGSVFALDIHYDFTIDAPSTHRASIRMQVENLQLNELIILKYSGPCPTRIYVISFKAYDMSGNELKVTPTPWDENAGWVIDSSGLSALVIEYIIETPPSWDNDHWMYYSYIGSDFSVFLPTHIYLAPPLNVQTDRLTTSFHIPQDWSIACAWKAADNIYDMKSTKPEVTPYPRPYTPSVIGMGKFDINTRRIGNAPITVASYSKWPSVEKSTFEKNIWALYSFFSSAWGDSLDQPYVVVVCPFADDGISIYGGTTEAGFIWSIPSYTAKDKGWYDTSTEINETRWTGYNWGFTNGDNCIWYYGGGASFQAISGQARKIILCDGCDADRALDSILTSYHQYVSEGKDMALSAMKPGNYDHDYPRIKGTLATFLFAREIYKRTNAKYTINDLNKVFIKKYWGTGFYITEEDFKREIELLTNSDFTEFFEKYVYGTTIYPFDWAKLDDDNDGVSNASEIAGGIDPSEKDTDRDGLEDGWEINNRLNPASSDTDGDGMPDGWEIKHALNPLKKDGHEDADADGFSNLREYRMGTDPKDPNSYPENKSLPWIPLLLLNGLQT